MAFLFVMGKKLIKEYKNKQIRNHHNKKIYGMII